MENLRYPIGKFVKPDHIDEEQRRLWIKEIETLPSRLRDALEPLTTGQMDTPYRPEGWTVRQVVHHVPDSHLNAYIRCKLALTEETPTIKPYFEDRWADLPDYKVTPIETSLILLDSLHDRWVRLLSALPEADFQRTFHHPEMGRQTLSEAIGLYAWHGNHHLAQITSLRDQMGW